jgi:uncharacterized membrane protein YkvA (DUF1232 family)
MNYQKLKLIFASFAKIAQSLINNKEKTLIKIHEGSKKAFKNKSSLSAIWDNLQLFFSIAKDYSTGNYTSIPKGSIIAIVAGLLYFVSPIDFIPDFIAGLGFIDDAYILTMVYRQVAKDLEKYKIWKAANAKIISI